MKKHFLIVGIVFINILFSQLYAQQSTSGKYRPANVSKGIQLKASAEQIIIDNVPIYLWRHGCAPTAVGMLIGYYDNIGFSDLIAGSATSQNKTINNAIANYEHYNDYSQPEDEYPDLFTDKSETGGAHSSNCIADFMQTSWSSKKNRYGWSWSNRINYAFTMYVRMRNKNYIVKTSYDNFSANSWNVYKNEIDNKRPVIILADTNGDGETNHFVIGIGYDATDSTYAVYDTWDSNIHWYKWRKIAKGSGWGVYGFNILQIYYNISAVAVPSNGGWVNGTGKHSPNQIAKLTASAQTGYKFVNWTVDGKEVSTDTTYSFTVSENRTLVANFNNTTAIPELENEMKYKIYPNPARDIINIEFENDNINSNKIEIVLFDLSGKSLPLNDFIMSQNKISLNISNVKYGVYYIQIIVDGKKTNKGKIVILK